MGEHRTAVVPDRTPGLMYDWGIFFTEAELYRESSSEADARRRAAHSGGTAVLVKRVAAGPWVEVDEVDDDT